jgi:predicted transcriptional regulator
MPSRDKYDIFLDILKAAGHSIEGSRMTGVIKEASLNAEQAKEMVIDLLEIGLLEFNSEEKTLTTTAKGWRFVRIYEDLNDFMIIRRKVNYTPISSPSD